MGRPDEAASVLPTRVSLVQPLGDRLNVHLSTPRGENLIAQVPADTLLRAGDSLEVHFDMSRAHFFAPGDDGLALALNRDRFAATPDRGAFP
jgi:ABC-type sugar transport system ATPase subunit